ncbi:MAG TPA: response regulator [Steroidobacteraceae bacterium]|jgi:DNA-binding NarL/FixJ family response regulator
MSTDVPNGSSLRVLLVEDSSLLAARLTELIRRLPDVELVDTADTESAALASIAVSSPDVVILDLHLRSGSGFGVLRSLAHGKQRPKIVILTNFGLPAYRREAESLGVAAFLDKSNDYYRLPALLQGFADERAPGSAH